MRTYCAEKIVVAAAILSLIWRFIVARCQHAAEVSAISAIAIATVVAATAISATFCLFCYRIAVALVLPKLIFPSCCCCRLPPLLLKCQRSIIAPNNYCYLLAVKGLRVVVYKHNLQNIKFVDLK